MRSVAGDNEQGIEAKLEAKRRRFKAGQNVVMKAVLVFTGAGDG
jgi:hypothetical protein